MFLWIFIRKISYISVIKIYIWLSHYSVAATLLVHNALSCLPMWKQKLIVQVSCEQSSLPRESCSAHVVLSWIIYVNITSLHN